MTQPTEQRNLLIDGWREGFNKVGFTKLLQQELGLPLATAKGMTDQVLERKPLVVNVADADLDRVSSLVIGLGGIVRGDASVVGGSCQ